MIELTHFIILPILTVLIAITNIGGTFFRLQMCFISPLNFFFDPGQKIPMNFKGQIFGNHPLRVNLGEAQVISYIVASTAGIQLLKPS